MYKLGNCEHNSQLIQNKVTSADSNLWKDLLIAVGSLT